MADLVTHLCTALLPGALVPPGARRLVPVVAFGTVLPDLLGRAVPLALERLYRLGLPLPEQLLWPWAALHEPAGWALASVLLSCAFVEPQRKQVAMALWLGCALHTALDLLQDHHGEGYLLLAPFSVRDFELGLIGSEATVDRAGWLCAVTICAWLPRGIELLLGPPRQPLAWWLLVAPMALFGGWGAACACAFAAGTAPWWRERPRLFAGVALLVLSAVGLVTWR